MSNLDLSVDICGVTLKNPVIPASGTFGFGREFVKFYDISKLGAVCAKGVTPVERIGNPPVRITETPSGILNAVGLQNPGIDKFIETELPWLAEQGATVIANIAGNTVEEYAILAEKLNNTTVSHIEVNVSCPNVHCGGKVFGATAEGILDVTKAVKKVSQKPIIIKLSPNVTDIVSLALAAEEGGADAVSLINTLTAMAIDVNTRKPIIKNVTGGLSGAAVRPVALRMCYQVANAVSVPVIGMGGIMNGEDAVMFLLAGCSAVQVGTANLINPFACVNIIDEIKEYMVKHNIKAVKELIGAIIVD